MSADRQPTITEGLPHEPTAAAATEPSGRLSRWARGHRPELFLVAAVGLVYWPILIGQVLFFRDPANWTYPARLFARNALLDGELPTWNPLQGLGFSVVANPLYGLFYPPNWLYLLVPAHLAVHMVTWQALGHLLFGGIGVALLARRLLPAAAAQSAAGQIAAFVAGGAYCLSGYITSQWTAGLLLLADAWVPWCGLGFLTLARSLAADGRAQLRGVVAAAAPLAAAFLLGEVFVALMAAAFGLGTAGVDLIARRARARGEPSPAAVVPSTSGGRGRVVLLVAVVLLLGAGAGAVTIVPAARAAAATDRAGKTFDRAFAEVASVHPVRLVEMIAPGALGVPYEDFPGGRWINEEALGGTPLSYGMYLGATVFALALLAFGRRRWLPLGLALLALFVLMVALGKHTPLHQGLRRAIPVMSYMRYPEKYMVLFTCWLALLAGLGTCRALAGEVRPRRILGLVALLLGLAGAAGLFPADLAPYLRRAALFGAAASLCVAVAIHLAGSRPRAAAVLLAGLVLGDLAAAAVPLQHFGPASVATRRAPVVERILRDARDPPAPPRAHRVKAAELSVARRFRVETHAEGQARAMQILAENASTTFGVALLPGYDAAIPSTASSVWMEGRRHGFRALRLFGASHLVLPAPEGDEPPSRLAALDPVFDPAPGARLYRVLDPLPRVYLAGQAQVPRVAVAEARVQGFGAELYQPDILAGKAVHLDQRDAAAVLPGPAGRAGHCRLTAFGRNHLQARCVADRAAIAVVLEQHAEGWRARVDGVAVPLLLVNRLYRGVSLASGEHVIELSFHPPGLAAGALVSAVSLALLVLAALAGGGLLSAPGRRGR